MDNGDGMVEVRWFDPEHNVVLWVFHANATIDCLQMAADRTRVMTANKPSFDVVADVSQIVMLPATIINVLHRCHRGAPANYGVAFIVGANVFVRATLSMATHIASIRGCYVLVETLDEARQQLQAIHQARC